MMFIREEAQLVERVQKMMKRGERYSGTLFPKNFEYGDFMNLKLYSLECYCTLSGDGNVILLLKDN